MSRKEIAISRRFVLIGLAVLLVSCLLLVGVCRCRPDDKKETIALSPTPAASAWWQTTQTPAPNSRALTLKAKITAESLNVREGPGPDYKIIGQVHRGDEVEILAQNSEGSWYKIRFQELVGWVSSTFVEVVAQVVAMAPASEPTCLCTCPCTPTPTTAIVVVPTATRNSPSPVASGTPSPPKSTRPPGSTPTVNPCPPEICTPPVRVVTSTPVLCSEPGGCLIPPTPTSPPLPTPEVVIDVICEEVPQPAYGINAALLVEPGIRQRALDRVAELGFNWVKIQIRWLDFESSKGQYTQSLEWLDQAVNDIHARGFNILLTVVGASDWAKAPGSDPAAIAPPANPQDYADFLAFLANRYYGQVQAFEVWNEQNLAREWGGRGRMNVGEYMALIRASYNSLSMFRVAVVSGGLTPTGTDDGLNAIADRRYLEEMYAAGLKDVTNGIGAHASGYNLPPFADWRNPPQDQCLAFKHTCTHPHPSWVFQQTLLDYHDVMVRHGEVKKQIWVTEFGWASCEGGFKAQEGYKYCEDNTQWEQAQWLREAYMGVKERGWTWVGVMFTWNLNFAELNGPDSEMSAFSILDVNGQPRPAFEALKNMPKW